MKYKIVHQILRRWWDQEQQVEERGSLPRLEAMVASKTQQVRVTDDWNLIWSVNQEIVFLQEEAAWEGLDRASRE